MVIFGLGAVGAAVADSATTLILMRGVQGVGAVAIAVGPSSAAPSLTR